ncbi:MAG: hypothetical protein ACRBF0_21955 [Calditrichia bacterium]
MKKFMFQFVIFTLAALLFAGCSSDSTGSNGDVDEFSDVVGTWNCTSFVYTSVANSSLTDDIKTSQGLSYSITIQENGAYTITVSVQGVPPQTITGQMATGTNGEFSTGDPDVRVTRSGNQLIFDDSNETHDFGSGSEAATLKVIYTKQ